jgi:hypothetical protein
MTIRRLASRSFVLGLFLLALAPVAAGCARPADGDDDGDDEGATESTTSALQAQGQDGLTTSIAEVEGSTLPTAEEAAERVAALPVRGFRPAGCATKTREGTTVTLKIDGCTGPFGKVTVVGSLVAKFSRPSPTVLHVDVATGPGTTTNGDPLTYSAQADARFEGSKRFVDYHGSSQGTTYRGKPFSRRTDLAIEADVTTRCASVDGTSKGKVGSYQLDVSIEGFEGCRDACPTAGTARATLDGPLVRGASVEVTFDGSDRARVTVDRGEGRRTTNHVVRMDCAAGEAI